MELEGGGQIATPLVQSANNEAQSPTVCNNTSYKVPNNVEIVTEDDLRPKSRNKSSDKAKKKRNISEAERERRRQSMLAILARKRERKAQAAV